MFFFFFNDTATPEIYPLSLPAALPISAGAPPPAPRAPPVAQGDDAGLGHALLHRVAEPFEALGDERAGAALLEPQLGVLVQVAARRDELSAVDGRQADHTRELGHS